MMISTVSTNPFGNLSSGESINLFFLKNKAGIEIGIINYGATVVSIRTPDKFGRFEDIVLGYDNLLSYQSDKNYFGSTIGRFANRIRNGEMSINNRVYSLNKNDGRHHLHGGKKGFHKSVWQLLSNSENEISNLTLGYLSEDGEEGYPGNLTVEVNFSLNNNNEFIIEYQAKTDKTTHINLTNHTYFNLNAHNSGTILNHKIQIYASYFIPVDSELIPIGEIFKVKGTPFDLTEPVEIGTRISSNNDQLKLACGYDHYFIAKSDSDFTLLNLIAKVTDPVSGRILEVNTTEPGLQFYTGNMLDSKLHGKGGHIYKVHDGFCLETQHYPDTPNQPHFLSTLLQSQVNFRSKTIYKFSAIKPD